MKEKVRREESAEKGRMKEENLWFHILTKYTVPLPASISTALKIECVPIIMLTEPFMED